MRRWSEYRADPASLYAGARWTGDGARWACECGLVLPHQVPLDLDVGAVRYGELHLGPRGYCQRPLFVAAPRAVPAPCPTRLVTNDYVVPREGEDRCAFFATV